MLKRKLPDWIDGYIEYSANSEPPYTFHLWTAISTIASVLQRKCSLVWGTLTFYPNMYIVLVAPSGRARKGTAMALGSPFLTKLGIKVAAEATTREALIRALKNANDSFVFGTSIGEPIIHSSLTILAPELTVFLGYNNLQLLSDLTDWYDCRDKWVYRTKHEGVDDIIGVYVNLYGATTPDLIRTVMPLDAIGGGLTSRMVFIYEENKGKVVPYPALGQREKEVKELLHDDLEQIHMLRGEFRFTPKFLDLWISWYLAQEKNPPFRDVRFNGYIERRPNHVMKLSIIMSASRSNEMIITEGDLRRAMDVLALTEQKMLRTFGGVGKAELADTLHSVMNEVGLRKEITEAELLQLYHRDVDAFGMASIIKTMEVMKFARKIIKPGGQVLIQYTEESTNEDHPKMIESTNNYREIEE